MNERLAWCELSEYCMVVWGDGMNYLICRTKKRWFRGGPGSRAHQGTPLVLFKSCFNATATVSFW